MKTQRIKTVSILTIAFLMMAGTQVYAQRGRAEMGQRNELRSGPNQECNAIPDLTEDQESKIESLRVEHLKEMTGYRNQLNELRAKKHTLMTSDNADIKEINSVIDQMSEVQNNMMKASAKHHQSVRALLTDDQKVYFDSRPRRGGRGHGMGHGNGMHAQGRGNF